MIRLSFLAACVVLLCGIATGQAEQTDLFFAGRDGYDCYRIPALLSTDKGTLLAFCEARTSGCADNGRIDTVLRRSVNGGKSWLPMQIVWTDGFNTCGNPAPVQDRKTGRVWLAGTWNLGTDREAAIADGTSSDTRRVFTLFSDDEGKTWSTPTEITSRVKKPTWGWYATGPGHGIQLTTGALVIAANHSEKVEAAPASRSHVFFSEDGGTNWQLGGSADARTNESTAAELENGQLYLNMRSYHGTNRRAVALSQDTGKTWGETFLDKTLIEPICQASVLRVEQIGSKPVYLFSNPASIKREKLTVRASKDFCRTWNDGQILYPGPAAYSDLAPLPDKMIGCMYEREREGKNYARITFARFPLQWILKANQSTQP